MPSEASADEGEIDEMNPEHLIRQEIEQTRATYRANALNRLQQAGADLDRVREDSLQAQNVLERSTIDAPVDGIVVISTIIRRRRHRKRQADPGDSASAAPLIVEVQVRRTDIDSVHVGEEAGIRLIALDRRTTPVLNGKVFYVSADGMPTKSSVPQDVYLARIELSPKELARVPEFSPIPGMPVEVLVQTAERTFFSYLVKPVKDSMSRAFTER